VRFSRVAILSELFRIDALTSEELLKGSFPSKLVLSLRTSFVRRRGEVLLGFIFILSRSGMQVFILLLILTPIGLFVLVVFDSSGMELVVLLRGVVIMLRTGDVTMFLCLRYAMRETDLHPMLEGLVTIVNRASLCCGGGRGSMLSRC
jgi:hypothetical protein